MSPGEASDLRGHLDFGRVSLVEDEPDDGPDLIVRVQSEPSAGRLHQSASNSTADTATTGPPVAPAEDEGGVALCRRSLEIVIEPDQLKDGLDLVTPSGRLMANILAGMAAYETEIRARILAGQAAYRTLAERWHASTGSNDSKASVTISCKVGPAPKRKLVKSVYKLLILDLGGFDGNANDRRIAILRSASTSPRYRKKALSGDDRLQ